MDPDIRAVLERNAALEKDVADLVAERDYLRGQVRKLNTALMKAKMRNAITRTGRR